MISLEKSQLSPQPESAQIDRLLTEAERLRICDYHASHDLATRALKLCRKLGDPVRTARALNLCSLAESWMGNLEVAITHAIAAIHIARQIHQPALECWPIIALATVIGSSGDTHDAIALLDRAEALAQQLNDDNMLVEVFLVRAALVARQGESARARELLDYVTHADVPLMSLPFADGLVVLYSIIVHQAAPVPDLEFLRMQYSQLLRHAEVCGSPIWLARATANLAAVAAKSGQMEQAETLLAEAQQAAGNIEDLRMWLDLRDARAEIELAAGRPEAAISNLFEMAQRLRATELGVREIATLRKIIQIFEQLDDPRGQIALYKRWNEVSERVQQHQISLNRAVVMMVYDMDHAQREADLRAQAQQAKRELELQAAQSHREQVALTEKLAQEHDLADRRQRMLRRISHEFRTPLAVIKSSASILRDYFDRLSPEQRVTHLDRVRGRVDWMTQMLEDVTWLIKPTDSSQPLPFESTGIEPLLEATLDGLAVYGVEPERVGIERNGLDSQMSLPAETLQVILTHLLVNALRFSSDLVQLTLTQHPGVLVVTVVDRGIGIPPADLVKVREPLIRGSNSGEIPGMGMGLAIAQQAVARWNGSMEIDSVLGHGTTVTLRLPLQN